MRRPALPHPTLLVVLGGSVAGAAAIVGLAGVAYGRPGEFVAALLCVAGGFVAASVANVRLGGTAARPPGSGTGTGEARIDVEERALVDSIIDFGDTVAREVMVPRPDMVTVEADFRAADVVEVMLLNGYSRLPACGSTIDDVVGLVYAKDLMRAERDGLQDRPVSEMLRPATFVPETKRLPELLREMQQNQFHMAIVVDEYGGTAGLVTLEDIIEELVGEIVDEYDVEDPMIEPLPGGGALVRGRTPLAEVNDLLDAHLPEGDWDTVGGLVYSRLSHVPVEGETVEVAGWQLTAQRIQGRRIGRVRMSRLDRSGGDEGVVGGAEALPIGLLVFVVGALIVANAWSVIDAKLAVNAAAREAARAYVEAPVTDAGGGSLAADEATAAGLAAIAAHGRDAARADIGLVGLEHPSSDGYVRCARVTFSASYQVPALSVPWIGGFGDGFDVSAQHSELVDPFRDGVPGEASC
ncbi:MAG TPA: hemolysin family protein [Acidimicrobiales bacterium]|nr:hemolysin family protein [Acidimicrobiales bacterium]